MMVWAHRIQASVVSLFGHYVSRRIFTKPSNMIDPSDKEGGRGHLGYGRKLLLGFGRCGCRRALGFYTTTHAHTVPDLALSIGDTGMEVRESLPC